MYTTFGAVYLWFGTGIWRKEIHRRSGNLPQQEFDKILKSLESKKLVKQVSSVQVCICVNKDSIFTIGQLSVLSSARCDMSSRFQAIVRRHSVVGLGGDVFVAPGSIYLFIIESYIKY